MKIQLKALVIAGALFIGLAAAPSIYAHESQGSKGSMMGSSMMGGGNMMGMMGQMNEMMETCNKMMQGMMKNHDAQKPTGPSTGQGAPQ